MDSSETLPANSGAPFLADTIETARDAFAPVERDMLVRLGVAVVAVWDELPRDFQRVLFEAAAAQTSPHDAPRDPVVRERIARFLHDNGHPHT